MPTYIGLEEQGFWKPFEMLGTALRSRADRTQRERFFKATQDRLKVQDQLQRKQIQQQMKINKFNFKQTKKVAGRQEALMKVTPETFRPTRAQAEQVLKEVGAGGTIDEASRQAYLADVLGPMDLTKPLRRQGPEAKERFQQLSAETGIPQEELFKKYENFRQMYGGPVPIEMPQVPRMEGYYPPQVQLPVPGGGTVSYSREMPNFFSGAGAGGPQAVAPGQQMGGYTMTGVSVNPQGQPSVTMKPTQQYMDEKRLTIVKAVEGNKAIANARKALGQFGMLKDLITKYAASGQSDMAIIFNFMKTIDPDSVVRESEFRAAGKTGSLPQNVQVWWNRMVTGEMLQPQMRKNFMNAAASSVRSLAENAQRTADTFDPEGVIGYNFRLDAAQLLPPPEFESPEAAEKAGATGELFPGQKVLVRTDEGTYAEATWQPATPAPGAMVAPPVTRP
jgi:hypothetical protein